MLAVLVIVGAILAVIFFDRLDFSILGAFLGFVLWRMNRLSAELKVISKKLHALSRSDQLDYREKETARPQPKVIDEDSIQIPIPIQAQDLESSAGTAQRPRDQHVDSDAIKPDSMLPPQTSEEHHSATGSGPEQQTDSLNKVSEILSKAVDFVKAYFTEGNVVVRVGAIILFFGVAFLLKYAAENSNISMEVRLIAVAFGALVLLAFGWKLKDKKQGYGLILQGTAVGILYITLFVSFRMYSLLPAGLVFSLLFVFSALAMALAVLQNSHSLAVLSVSGGFLAPVLTSTGAGSHVALFSYYAILNLGIFAVAWYRSWRLLNLIGFAFTFIIGSAWGVTKYQPEDFATTEPFLVLYFLLYSVIALLFAIKQKPVLKGYVDSTLIFGLPIICFSLQSAMVHSMEFALAWSALALGGFYLASAFLVLRGKNEHLKIIAEAYLALGIIFISLVIPLAVDGRWTSAAWAIEGGGLIWLGLRQARWFPKYFGALIQFGGGMLFLFELEKDGLNSSVLDSDLLGIVLVSLAALFTSFQIWKRRESLPAYEAKSYLLFFIWGLMWWYTGAAAEIEQHLSGTLKSISGWVIFVAISGLIANRIEAKFNWNVLRVVNWLTFIGLFLAGVIYFSQSIYQAKFFTSWYGIMWLLAIASYYWTLYQTEQSIDLRHQKQSKQSELRPKLHLLSLLSLIAVSIVVLRWFTGFMEFRHSPWSISLFALLAAAWMWLLTNKQKWPISFYQHTYSIVAQRIVMAGGLLWSVMFNFPNAGIASPLLYLPLLNPLDIAQGMLMLLAVYIVRKSNVITISANTDLLKMALAVFIFAWLNVILLRSIHAWVHIPYDLDRMMASTLVQTSLSIFWTVLGLTGTIFASRASSRKMWIYAVGLIAIVVVKLFLVDLDNSSSIERIVSFLVVGILLLTVGYFSPLPAKEEEQNG